MAEKDLIAFCGLYCGACGLRGLKEPAEKMKQILDAYNYADIAKFVPGMEDYPAFEKILTEFTKQFCPACRQGGGNPNCVIRICAKERGFDTCADCNEMPCEKAKFITEGYPDVIRNLERIKQIGSDRWLKEQREKVAAGFSYTDALSRRKKQQIT